MRKILLLLILLFCIFNLSAQDLLKDMEIYSKYFEEKMPIRLFFHYNLYPNAGSKEILENQEGVYIKNGNCSYFKIENIEFVSINGKELAVDNSDKSIMIDPSAKKTQKPFLKTEEIKAFLKECSKIDFKKSGNDACYTLNYNKDNEFNKIEIHFDAQNKMMRKIIFYYNNIPEPLSNLKSRKPRFEIIIEQEKAQVIVPKTLFDFSHYVSMRNGKWHPGASFRNYQVFENKK